MPFIELVAQRRPPTAPAGMKPPENAKDWFRVENSVDEEDSTDIYVYESIGGWFGMWADEFVAQLKQVATSKINLRLNSPGGSVFDGIAIANAIRSHPASVTVYVDSLAASIASVIALAGDRVVMMPQSQFMVHNASGACYGDASEMTKMADLLDKQSRNIAEAYAQHTGGTLAEWQDYMAAETWFTAEEAVAVGLADEVMPMRTTKSEDADAEPEPASAMAQMSRSWDLSMYTYAGRDAAPAPDIKSPSAATAAAGQVITIAMLNGLGLDEQVLDTIRAGVRASAEQPAEEVPVTQDATPADGGAENASTPPAPAEKPDPDEDEPDEDEPGEEPDEPDDDPPKKASARNGLDDDTEGAPGHTETHDADDDWHGLVDHILTPPSSADDVFNSLKEEWQI